MLSKRWQGARAGGCLCWGLAAGVVPRGGSGPVSVCEDGGTCPARWGSWSPWPRSCKGSDRIGLPVSRPQSFFLLLFVTWRRTWPRCSPRLCPSSTERVWKTSLTFLSQFLFLYNNAACCLPELPWGKGGRCAERGAGGVKYSFHVLAIYLKCPAHHPPLPRRFQIQEPCQESLPPGSLP